MEAGEELLFRGRPGGCGAHLAAQGGPGCFAPAVAGCLLRLGAGSAPRGGAIPRSGAAQPQPALGFLAGLPDAVEVVPDLGPGAVLAGQRGHDVNVIGGVPYGHPPHPQVIALGREPGVVHDPRRDLRPLRIRQDPVLGGGAYRAVPDRLVVAGTGEGCQRLGQQPVQAAQVRCPAGTAFRLQFRRIGEPGDQMRIGMLVCFSGPVQVVQQPLGIGAPEHFPDHPAHSHSVTERSGAIAPLPRPIGGSPARKTGPPGADHHHAAPSHSSGPLPDSDSCPPAAPARQPT